ncbi:MAG TPA: hypothetical protein VH062_06635 [Polyangiaceae bacterium]|jgi:chromosome segregation ATPase|nr:hypothetical protein [Polyangiaceae bacterium]
MKNPFRGATKATQVVEPESTTSAANDIEARAADVAARTNDLAVAREAHEAKLATVETARARYYELGDEVSKTALRNARIEAEDVAEDVGRAEVRLARAEDAKKASHKLADEQRRKVLEAELSFEAVRAAATPLANEEAELIMRLADVRLRRRQLARIFEAKASDLRDAMTGLGIEPSNSVIVGNAVHTREGAHVHFADGPTLVGEALATKIEFNDPRRELVAEIFNPRPTRL